ncbi:MAG TPA: hypothetical protein EYQ66_09410 [Myxococcales bacterium]|nr:hypothetical protein [Myxococcales bacterium]HIL02534.1 hypothetical protein [Myxococcales bacterium]
MDRISKRQRRQRGQVNWMVFLLIVLFSAGGWNYFRSYQADLKNHRNMPFSSYSTPDLSALQAAYNQALESSRSAYSEKRSAQDRPPRRNSDRSNLADRVRALERSQAKAGGLRSAQADLAQAEARLGEIEAEIERRSEFLAGLRVHFERLFRRGAGNAESP